MVGIKGHVEKCFKIIVLYMYQTFWRKAYWNTVWIVFYKMKPQNVEIEYTYLVHSTCFW
jgi:hypothetical protein